MKSRQPIGYVVLIDGSEVTLNLLDLHRGQVASHTQGVSSVTEVGSLLAVDAGSRLLVMRVLSLSFAEPREAHRLGVGTNARQMEPLRSLSGVIVGRLVRNNDSMLFIGDSLPTPPLGAEAFPLTDVELAASLGNPDRDELPISVGEDIRGGGTLRIGLESLISRHVAVLGSSGQGKSCFTAAMLQQIVRFPRSRIVVFDINNEYPSAFDLPDLAPTAVKRTTLGGSEPNSFKLPYYALGRFGLNRLLVPSEKTQRPALAFALENLRHVKWFPSQRGAGLGDSASPVFFDDCRSAGAADAERELRRLRQGSSIPQVASWPCMSALSSLVAESHSIQLRNGTPARDAFLYGNVSPLVTRINRLVEDPMFSDIVEVGGGDPIGTSLDWRREASSLVERIFGEREVDWRVHIVNLRRVAHDLMPFVLGSVLELYAHELFRRGQENAIPTLLVLEEAHHYMRSIGAGEEAQENALAYERLAKEGRKFGLAMWLSTQRPSEISPTVLSQCNNWITFRLTSEKDLSAIQSASEWADRREIRRIAGLPRQTAIAFGGSIAMPIMLRAPDAKPRPASDDGNFSSWGTDLVLDA